MDPVTARTPRSRATRSAAIVLVVLLVPLAAHAVWDQIEASRFQRYVALLRATGEPVDLRDEDRPLDSDEQRRASRLYYAAAVLAADGLEPFKHLPPSADAPAAALPNARVLAAQAERRVADSPAPAADPQFAQLSGMLAASDAALDLLDRAAALEFTRFSPERAGYSYLTNDLINLSALNAVRVDLRALAGDGEGAAAALYSGVRLGRTPTGFGRFLAGSTFGSLRLLLERTQPGDAALSRLQQVYAASSMDDGLARDTVETRARMIGAVWPTTARPFFAQRLGNRGWARDWRANSATFVALRPWITARFLQSLHELDAAIAIAKQPWPDKLRAQDALKSGPPTERPSAPARFLVDVMQRTGILVWTHPAAEIIGPAMTRAGRTLAQNRVAVAVLAMERWRRAHDGVPASDLQALVPSFLTAVPEDPFTGQPLRVINDQGSYTIYSQAEDRTDNGGDIGDWVPAVLGGNRPGRERDIGIRVPIRQRRVAGPERPGATISVARDP